MDSADRTLEFIGEDVLDHTPKNEKVLINWQITSNTHDFQKQDARTIHFPVKISAGAELTLRYSVQYTW